VIACGGSVVLLDWVFRLYERRFLIHELESGGPYYDLTELRYNDHVGTIASERVPGEFRILSFGDSFAESATTSEYSYASVLERTLQAALPDRRIRVVNFGRSKTSFPDYVSQYRIWSQRLEFDAVLFNIYTGNDFHEVRGTLIVPDAHRDLRVAPGASTLQFGLGLEVPHRYPLRFLDYVYAQFATHWYAVDSPSQYRKPATHAKKAAYARAKAHQVAIYRPADFLRFREALFWVEKLARLAREIESTGARVLLAVSPPHFMVSPEWNQRVLEHAGATPDELIPGLPAAAVRAAADRSGVSGPVIDLTPCLQKMGSDGTELYFGTNTHWSVAGNELVGRLLAASIADHWFSRTLPDAQSPPLDCTTIAAPPSGEVTVLLDSMLETVDDLLRFETRVFSALRQQNFPSETGLRAKLVALGYHEDPEAMRGEFWGFLKDSHGWALDATAVGEPVVVALFHEGRVVSAVRTQKTSARLARKLGLRGADTAPLLYRTETRGTLRMMRGGRIWAVAISQTGRFGMLRIESAHPR